MIQINWTDYICSHFLHISDAQKQNPGFNFDLSHWKLNDLTVIQRTTVITEDLQLLLLKSARGNSLALKMGMLARQSVEVVAERIRLKLLYTSHKNTNK